LIKTRAIIVVPFHAMFICYFWVIESLRAGNKVSSLVEQYSQLQHTVLVDDAKSPTTPPRGRSPETMETYEQKYVLYTAHRIVLVCACVCV